jgi:hypothetical protein
MRLLPALLTVLSIALPASMAGGQPSGLEAGGVRFGPAVRMEGVYFTNFENSLFTECAADACSTATNDAVVMCERSACEDLEARIKALNGDHDRPGRFNAVFHARRALEKTPKRFLHDREDKIYLERIERFELIPTTP